MSPDGSDARARQVAREISDEVERRVLALTAVIIAAQERLDADIILSPREKGDQKAVVYTVERNQGGQPFVQYIVCYRIPDALQKGSAVEAKELLSVVLDIAHELAHLVLQGGPGRLEHRPGVPENDKKMLAMLAEVEADWFALCVLQMYGFWCVHHPE